LPGKCKLNFCNAITGALLLVAIFGVAVKRPVYFKPSSPAQTFGSVIQPKKYKFIMYCMNRTTSQCYRNVKSGLCSNRHDGASKDDVQTVTNINLKAKKTINPTSPAQNQSDHDHSKGDFTIRIRSSRCSLFSLVYHAWSKK